MQRRFHPGPLTILVAIVLCLMASFAFGQVRRVAPGGAVGARAPTALPAPSGLTSGAAPGLVSGTPAASGLTSGSSPALPPGSPAASGLTSGTTGGTSTVSTSPDMTATPVGGSTRGVVVIPIDTGAGTVTTQAGLTTPAAGATGVSDTTATPAGTAGAAVVSGFAGVTNGVPSVAPGRLQTMGGGPLTALQVAQMFAQADADGDGLLTRAEALRLPMVTMSFDDMDTNRDGVVSRSEYESSLR